MFKVIKLNIDLTKLRSNILDSIDVDINYSFSEEQLKDTNILEIKNLKVTGTISNTYDDLELNLRIMGTSILPCSISLKPVECPINIKIEGNLSEFIDNFKNIENTLDIFPIIWENILVEIPSKVISNDLSDIKKSGDGWELITEIKEETNPELEKLKDLL